MAYATYNFYINTYHGRAITNATDFAILAERASDYIDYITRDKADGTDVKVQRACCAMAEQYQVIEKSELESSGGSKQSETVGDWSVTYRSGVDQLAKAEKELYGIATRYLMKYMYRGGCSCTCRTP